jgi:hypothetical protein
MGKKGEPGRDIGKLGGDTSNFFAFSRLSLLFGGFPLCFVSLVGVGPLLLLLLLPSLHFLRRLHRPLLPVLSKRYFFSFLSPFIFFNENHLGLGSLTILPLERWVLFALRF